MFENVKNGISKISSQWHFKSYLIPEQLFFVSEWLLDVATVRY